MAFPTNPVDVEVNSAAVVAQLRRQSPGTSPLRMRQSYQNLSVPIQNQQGSIQTIHGISATKYLLAENADRSMFKKIKDIAKKWERNRQSGFVYAPTNRRKIVQVFEGKGTPEEIEFVLALAASDKKICAPSQSGLQSFADSYLGVDCSGFVNAYFKAKGKLPRTHLGLWIGSYQAGFSKDSGMTGKNSASSDVRASLAELQMDDCLIWVNKDGDLLTKKNSPTGYGHIALVQSVDPTAATIEVVEARGGRNNGITQSTYKVTKQIGNRFYVDRPGADSWVQAARLNW